MSIKYNRKVSDTSVSETAIEEWLKENKPKQLGNTDNKLGEPKGFVICSPNGSKTSGTYLEKLKDKLMAGEYVCHEDIGCIKATFDVYINRMKRKGWQFECKNGKHKLIEKGKYCHNDNQENYLNSV